MNFGPLRIGQNLLCMLTAGKTGLTCWRPPGPGFISAGLKFGLPGPSLRALPPCNGKPTFGCARFGLNLWAFGLTCWRPGLLRFGLLSRTLGLTRCRLGFTAWKFLLTFCGCVNLGATWTGLLICTCGAGRGVNTCGATRWTGAARWIGAAAGRYGCAACAPVTYGTPPTAATAMKAAAPAAGSLADEKSTPTSV